MSFRIQFLFMKMVAVSLRAIICKQHTRREQKEEKFYVLIAGIDHFINKLDDIPGMEE